MVTLVFTSQTEKYILEGKYSRVDNEIGNAGTLNQYILPHSHCIHRDYMPLMFIFNLCFIFYITQVIY